MRLTSSRRTRECLVIDPRILLTRLMWPEKVDRLSCRFWLSPTSARILSNQAMAGASRSPAIICKPLYQLLCLQILPTSLYS